MAPFSRRSIIKGLTALSLGALGGSKIRAISRSHENAIALNVVLHGLFVLNLLDDGIQLLTPFVEEHIYRAGNWSWASISDLRAGRTYQLKGVEASRQAPQVHRDCSLVLSRSEAHFQVRPENSYVIVHLPFPREIRFLRCLRGQDLFSGPAKDLIHADGISLCPVLIYDSADYEQTQLEGAAWAPWVQPETRSANLHLWAEPAKELDPMHGSRAYAKLMDLIPPLQFSLATDAKPPLDKDTGVRGLPPVEELGWSEWRSNGEGSWPTNCSSIVVTK